MSVDPALLSFGGYTAEHGRQAAKYFLALDRPPTAIFASSDQIAIGVLDVLRANDLRVPTDISIVAYDDVAPFSHFGPPLTAVRQPIARMGARAVEILMAHLSDPSGEPTVERLPVEFMQRDSVASPAHVVLTSRQTTRRRTGR
jgi:LacI family transcriptional regulator